MSLALAQKPVVDEFNSLQRVVLDTYENGELAHIKTVKELNNCGDTLLRFLVNECSTDADCTDEGTAIHRMNKVISQVKGIRNTFVILQAKVYVP
ncbi:MAG: hypothetical protein ACTS9Y_00620 [Methylophilus sp.]|uniref:hypothetical protein n=1 Tax=Methylophilus sp. TaxID=29541 RepID=UPI003F9F0B38